MAAVAHDKKGIGLTADAQKQLKVIMDRGWFAHGQDAGRLAFAYAVAAGVHPRGLEGIDTRWATGNFDPTGELQTLVAALYPESKTPVRTIEALVNEGMALLHERVSKENAGPVEVLE